MVNKKLILFLAKSLGDAYHQFTHDNKTEFPNEVNILERFNIYQEIFLGIIYRVFQPKLRPILWYAYSGMDLLFMTTFIFTVVCLKSGLQKIRTFAFLPNWTCPKNPEFYVLVKQGLP